MKHSLVPGGSSGELTTKSFSTATTFADLLLEEGYVVMLSREEDLYIINYIWSEMYANRNDVVFMDRCDFDMDFYEIEEDEEDEEDDYREERTIKNTEREVWYYAQKLINTFPSEVEKIFGVDQMSNEERERFWELYPDQLSYDEVKAKFTAYNDQHNAEIGEKVMEACLAEMDRHNEKKYEREKQREEYQCEGQLVMEEFDDQST